MSRIKLILSILLMLFLLLVAIFLPSRLRERNETPDTKSQEETASQEETTQPEELTEMDFLSFEELSQFFSSAQTVSLKEQFPVYLTRTGQTDITSAEYLPDETGYPDTTTVELHFLLSDDSTLPVFYDTMTGAFSFGEERTVLGTSGKTNEKPVADTLPSASSSEVEQGQEGGYADVTAPESSAPDTGTEETGTTQSGASENAADPAQNTQDGEEVLPWAIRMSSGPP